eukprot:jgi/Tetstr1/444315/TSEL_032206.t1
MNRYCETRDLSFEVLSHLRDLARHGDYMLQMDLYDGFYAVGIAHEDRDFFTVDYRGTLYRLAGLPMGRSLSPYYFCQFANVLTRALRRNLAEADGTPIPRGRFALRMLPYMDDFLFLARTQAEPIWQRDYIERHLSGFGLLRNPNKGVWEPTQKLVHLGARWRDPRCEAVDALRLSDAAWHCERNWCNPPWNLIGDLVSKLESSGAAPAIVIVPYWPDKA